MIKRQFFKSPKSHLGQKMNMPLNQLWTLSMDTNWLDMLSSMVIFFIFCPPAKSLLNVISRFWCMPVWLLITLFTLHDCMCGWMCRIWLISKTSSFHLHGTSISIFPFWECNGRTFHVCSWATQHFPMGHFRGQLPVRMM